MADIIQLLPDSVANQIAAGEVIQRPASVVKELVENAIDAGATKIQVVIKDAGRTLIQVTDNGKGMSPTDARMAFERHATSKIKSVTDIFIIKTMGFRGEALASIASIADVELKTCRENDEVGTFIHISGSDIIRQESVACQIGTTFMVKNLFFNVPARRKFLKTNAYEIKIIIGEIQRIALANPGVALSLHNESTAVYEFQPENYRKRIISIFGKNMNQSLIPLSNTTSLVEINGFIGHPKYARKTVGEQFFFVNNRFMKHPFFHKAVMQAYEKILPPGMIPSYFINFSISPESIDVNIHPTKTEIKFEDESAIWQLVHAIVRESLGKFNVVPSIDFDQSGSFEMPIALKSTDGLHRPEIAFNPNFNPFETESNNRSEYRPTTSPREKANLDNWQQLYNVPIDTPEQASQFMNSGNNDEQSQMVFTHPEPIPDMGKNFIQFKNRYILMPVKSGLMVIDQRRAHQRVLYEKFIAQLQNHETVSQQLLFPQVIETNAADATLLNSVISDLSLIGFDIREFGPNTFIINGIPLLIENSDPKGVIEFLLESFKSGSTNIKEMACEQLAVSLSLASSINYGQSLSNEEVEHLIDSLFACSTPSFSPTGKPVLEIIPVDEFEKRLR